MEKNAISIPVEAWGTIKSKYEPDSRLLTPDDFTLGTKNIDSKTRGALSKRPGGIPYSNSAFASKIQDQFEAIFTDGQRHLLVQEGGRLQYSTGDRNFTQVATGFAADSNFEFVTTQDRVYMGNGINSPQVYDRTVNYGGVVYSAPFVKPAGLLAPSAAPSVAVAAGGNVPVGAHTYKITYLYYEGEESNGGPSSVVATTTVGNQTVNLTSIPVGGYGVTARKVYRDNNDQVYVLVGTISNNTATTFSDTAAGGTTPIPTDQGTPPTFALITLFLNRLFVAKIASDPSTMFFSEIEQPDIFKSSNFITCNQEDPITGIVVYQDKIIVFNRKSMGQILGRTSDQFRYASIPGSIGCVDNRTIQVRTLDGIPVLVWLSDRGFYTYNGQSINYISEGIEDQVNLNIQQASQQTGKNSQSTQAEFQQGTASGGIDLISNPGFITTVNPKVTYDDRTDWESGTPANFTLLAGDNLLKMPTQYNISPINVGTVTGDMTTNPLTLPTSTNHTGNGSLHPPFTAYVEHPSTVTAIAGKFTVPRAGNVTGFTVSVRNFDFATTRQFKLTLWSDNSGNPNSILFQSPTINIAGNANIDSSTSCNVSLAAGQTFYIGIEKVGGAVNISVEGALFGTAGNIKSLKGGVWSNSTTGLNTMGTISALYTFNATPIPKSGTWTSPSFDTQSNQIQEAFAYLDGTFPATFPTKTFNFIIEASTDNVSFTQVYTSSSRADLSGVSFNPGNRRYFRFKVTMAVTDNRSVDSVTSMRIQFQGSTDWTSPTIDVTADATLFNSLTVNSTTPSSTSVTTTIATSASPSGPFTGSGNGDGQFGPFGSAIVRRYVKIRVTLARSNFAVTPSVSFIQFKWTVVANLISKAIDTGATPPAGWDVFQSTYAGLVTFQQRSASTLGGLSSATFFTVTNGTFPPVSLTPLQFTQWKAILTATADALPTVDSVTINWFISLVKAIRPASIFHDRSYYMAAASFNSLVNDLMFEFDLDGNWRIHEGLSASTFSFFFNQPYYGGANTFKVFKFAEGLLDDGVNPIVLDARTKAFDFTSTREERTEKKKTIKEVWLTVSGTGAGYQVSYSVDNGLTFIPMIYNEGGTTFTSLADNKRFVALFIADHSSGNAVSGDTIMIRVVSGDAFDTRIHRLKLVAWARRQDHNAV